MFVKENESSAKENLEQLEPHFKNDDELTDFWFVSAKTEDFADQPDASNSNSNASMSDGQS